MTQLSEGVPAVGTVQSLAYDEYVFNLLSATSITFALTVTAGDPDAYLGCDAMNLPNATNNKV